jgi:membrane-associated phospholipid phosphatase
MPATRVIAIIVSVPMLLSLVAMNYHFVSDVIAGSVLGALIATYGVHLARLKIACEDPRQAEQ